MVSKGQTRLVDARSPLYCPYLITWGTLCPLSLWMGSEIKRSHFDLNIVPDSVVKSGPRVSWSDRGWLVRWKLSAIPLGLWSWYWLSPCYTETVRLLLHGFGASGGNGWCQMAGAQGYSWGSQKMVLPPTPNFPLRPEVFLFSSVPWEASLPTVTRWSWGLGKVCVGLGDQ